MLPEQEQPLEQPLEQLLGQELALAQQQEQEPVLESKDRELLLSCGQGCPLL
jgi:hypothetical protein